MYGMYHIYRSGDLWVREIRFRFQPTHFKCLKQDRYRKDVNQLKELRKNNEEDYGIFKGPK